MRHDYLGDLPHDIEPPKPLSQQHEQKTGLDLMREEFRGEGGSNPIPFDPLNPGARDVPGGGYLATGPM